MQGKETSGKYSVYFEITSDLVLFLLVPEEVVELPREVEFLSAFSVPSNIRQRGPGGEICLCARECPVNPP